MEFNFNKGDEVMSLKYKLIIFLLLVTVIPGVTAIAATYIYTTESVKNQLIKENTNIVSKGKADLRDYFITISEIPISLYTNRLFMNVMEHGINEELDQSQAELKRSLFGLYHSRKEIEQIFLYVDKGNDAYTIYNSKLSSRALVENKYFNTYYQQLHERNMYFSVEPTHDIYSYNNQSNIFPSSVKKVLSFHHSLHDVTSSKFLGFISIDIDIDAVKTISDRLHFIDEEDFYLIDGSNNVIYSSEESLIGFRIDEQWVKSIRDNVNEKKSHDWEDDEFNGVLVYDQFIEPFDDWLIVKRIPSDRIYSGPRYIAKMNISILAVFLIIIIFATVFVSFKIISPMKILMNNMKKVEEGKLEVDFDSLGNDEFGKLGQHFKSMVNRINDLILREYRLEIENKTNQIKVLQSQINPHFLYNSLQSIGTIALKKNVPEVYKLLTTLSSIMRYGMNMSDDSVVLEKEINHAKSYLLLQKQRFRNSLQFEISVDESVRLSFVPKMILQPIVENYLKHGFDSSKGIGVIKIVARKSKGNGRLIIVIEDNGEGVSEERLEMIRLSLTKGIKLSDSGEENIGLKNVYERLKLYYGTESSFIIENRQEGGLRVVFELPITKEVTTGESIDRR